MPLDGGQATGASGPEQPRPTGVISGPKAAFFFLLGTVGAAASVLSVETPVAISGWLLLAVASTIGGVIAVTAAAGLGAADWPTLIPLPPPPWPGRLLRVTVALGLAAVVGLVAVTVGPPALERIWPPDCGQPVELRVLTSPANLAPYQEVAEEYERWTSAMNNGCQTANLFVYGPPVSWSQEALTGGWAAPRLTEWPRPDVWLPDTVEHAAEVQAATRTGQEFELVVGEAPIAETPVVLAVRSGEPLGWLAGERSWWGVVQAAEQDGRGLVRSVPEAGGTGLLATAAIYTTAGPSPGELATPEQATAAERLIAATMDRGYRLDDPDDEILRRYAAGDPLTGELTGEPVGLIVSEQAMVRYNQEIEEGEGCVVAPNVARLQAHYPQDTPSLRRHVVRLEWSDAAGPQRTAAVEFEQWLTTAEGRRALAAVALRPPGVAAQEPIGAACGADPETNAGPPPAADQLEDVLQRYRDAQRPGRLLLLLDSSGSMKQEVIAGQSRMDMAATAVKSTVATMTGRDEFGLWTFPGGGDAVRVLVPMEAAPTDGATDSYLAQRRRATSAALEDLQVGGPTPLYRAIVAGVEELLPADPDRVGAVLVITDGEDSEDRLTATTLVRAVTGKEIRVFVVAVGDVSCASQGLAEVTEATGGSCRDAAFDTLDRTVTDLSASIWGAGDAP